MKRLSILFLIPVMANASLVNSLVSDMERREVVSPADWYTKGDSQIGENINVHRQLKISLTEKKISLAVKFPDQSSKDDLFFYGIDECHAIFSEIIPDANSGTWSKPSTEGQKLDLFFESVKSDSKNNKFENEVEIKGWSLSVKLKANQVWCVASNNK